MIRLLPIIRYLEKKTPDDLIDIILKYIGDINEIPENDRDIPIIYHIKIPNNLIQGYLYDENRVIPFENIDITHQQRRIVDIITNVLICKKCGKSVSVLYSKSKLNITFRTRESR